MSKEKSDWSAAASGCHSADLEFLSLNTANEADNFFKLAKGYKYKQSLGTVIHVGGQIAAGKKSDDWVWMETGEKICYEMKFAKGQPNKIGVEKCLAIGNTQQNGSTLSGFHDVPCEKLAKKFFCQKIRSFFEY